MQKLSTGVCILFSTLVVAQLPIDYSSLNLKDIAVDKKILEERSKFFQGAGVQGLKIPDTSNARITAAYDSLYASKKKSTDNDFFYSNIVNNRIIDPDSLIKNLEVFGHSVFLPSRLQGGGANRQAGVTADYPVASGDEINILLWGRINEEYRLVVDRNGDINIPRIGPVSVAGQPFSSMQKNIINRVQSIEGVQASVSMGTLNDTRVFIVGEVTVPGQYTIGALTNVTNAIFSASGFSRQGSMRNVVLMRNGKAVGTFDFYDFLMSGNNFSSIRLKTDDVIYVPVVKKMAAIIGNVRRSAFYELKGKTLLKDLIELAGGLTPAAWVNRIQVQRLDKNKQQIVLDLEVKSSNKLPDFEINDGDIVKIFPVVNLDFNTVYLCGNVKRPGKYEFRENMRISYLVNNYEQLLPETYFNYAVIRRHEPPSYATRILSFNLGAVLEDTTSTENMFLQPSDSVIVYNRDYFEPDRIVSISGAVTKPGTFRLLKNMRIKDLILESGGLTEEASQDRGELYNRVYQNDGVKTQKITFLVSRAMQDDPEHNLRLSKFDQVFIRKKRGWEDQKTITLVGEFNYPGTYVVLENETLGDIITRAGGFREEAYRAAAIFTRRSVKDLEKKRMEDYANQLERDMAALTTQLASNPSSASEIRAIIDQQKAMLEKLRTIEPIGRVVIDLEQEDNYKNLQLENDDVLYLPKNLNTVSVIGEVFNPATFVLEKYKKRVPDYIEFAGGYKDNANEKDVYVIKANGSVRTKKMVRLSRYELDPGDAVVVPFKLPTFGYNKFKLFMETIQTIANITSTSLAVAATIALLRK